MKRLVLAGILAALMVAAVVAAGCASPTPSPTPTLTTSATTSVASGQNVSQYLTATMQQRNFTVVTPFALQASPQAGVAVYNATVSDANGTYTVSVEALNTTPAAQARFQSVRDDFIGRGFAAVLENGTAWSGFNSSARMGAAVEYGSSPLVPNYVMIITGGATGSQAPFQQGMWTHMWDEMHQYTGLGGGMGPYMGYRLTNATLTRMQQEMQEHIGAMEQ